MISTRAIFKKLQKLKLSLSKQRNIFANNNQTNKKSVRVSFAICEMIAKSPCLLQMAFSFKAREILCLIKRNCLKT